MFFNLFQASPKAFASILRAAHVPAANTAAVVTIAAAGVNTRHVLHKLMWSYSAAPTGGNILTNQVTNPLNLDVTAGGPGSLTFSPRAWNENEAMVITLAAGGAGIIGKLHIEYVTEIYR